MREGGRLSASVLEAATDYFWWQALYSIHSPAFFFET